MGYRRSVFDIGNISHSIIFKVSKNFNKNKFIHLNKKIFNDNMINSIHDLEENKQMFYGKIDPFEEIQYYIVVYVITSFKRR